MTYLMHPQIPIAFFVTAHGFGHAARACAVMNAIYRRWPYARFEIFTRVPEWFFADSLEAPFIRHAQSADVGLVQTTPFAQDLEKTIDALDHFLPFNDAEVASLAERLHELGVMMILCDISPLGIAVGKQAEIPSVLIENFTWDWIYAPYAENEPRIAKHIDYLGRTFEAADHHIQTQPLCRKSSKHIIAPPIARSPRLPKDRIRQALGIPEEKSAILVTTGGVPHTPRFIEKLDQIENGYHFVLPVDGAKLPKEGQIRGNVTLLPHASAFYHPDLVQAVDAVVAKAGYSTVAEVYHAAKPFGFIPRADFRESPCLAEFIHKAMTGLELSEADFSNGAWLNRLDDLIRLNAQMPDTPNGADVVADHICGCLVRDRELLEIVSPDGTACGAAPRKSVHGNNALLHRVVHVLVFDQDERLLLQKRSRQKRVAPGQWDTSVGGHVDCGERIEAAMFREMAEELGIEPLSPTFAYQYIHTNDFESEMVFTYICQYSGQIRHNPEEIDEVRFWPLSDIEALMGSGTLSDNFEDEFRHYMQWRQTRRNPTPATQKRRR